MDQMEAEATQAKFLAEWDALIKRTAQRTWSRLRPASCSWEDIAQEVRVRLLPKQMLVRRAEAPAAFMIACVRNESFQALKRLARDEFRLGSNLTHLEDEAWVHELLYSSRGGESSDRFLD